MYINTAEEISGIPASWPGQPLDIGSSGSKIRQIQEQLNAIANAYPALPKISVDGVFGENTQNAKNSSRFSDFLPQELLITPHGTKFRKFT